MFNSACAIKDCFAHCTTFHSQRRSGTVCICPPNSSFAVLFAPVGISRRCARLSYVAYRQLRLRSCSSQALRLTPAHAFYSCSLAPEEIFDFHVALERFAYARQTHRLPCLCSHTLWSRSAHKVHTSALIVRYSCSLASHLILK